MSKTVTWCLIILLIVAVFLLAPLLLPSEENGYSEYNGSQETEFAEDGDTDIDFHKKSVSTSARSVGGSKSFRSGK